MLEGVLTIDRSIDPDDEGPNKARNAGPTHRRSGSTTTLIDRQPPDSPTKTTKFAHSVALATTGGHLRNRVGEFLQSVDLIKWVLTNRSVNRT